MVLLLRFYSAVLGATGVLVIVVITDLRLLSVVLALFAVLTGVAYHMLRRHGPLPVSPKLVVTGLIVAALGLEVAGRADMSSSQWVVAVASVVLAPAAIGWVVRSIQAASAVIDESVLELAQARPEPLDPASRGDLTHVSGSLLDR
jgi:hypothetical protein